MIQETELNWVTVHTEDSKEMAEFNKREAEKAGERIRAEFKRLRDLGIVDESGELINRELPLDMQPGAKRDFGG
jgi:hypothetical protein